MDGRNFLDDTVVRLAPQPTGSFRVAFASLLLLFSASVAVHSIPPSSPLPGQLIIDGEHPQWLRRHGGKHVFICGPGDPEDFLYRGQRNMEGTRRGDQEALIQKLIRHGGNCIYMQIVRSHGGDGGNDHNPFVDSDPAKGVDQCILVQWERWLSLMDENGILIYLFFYDDGSDPWRSLSRDRDTVSPEEKLFLETIVDRFKKFRNLIWIVAEESEEALSTERVHGIAGVIRASDEFGHLVGNHHHSGANFKAWRAGGGLNHYAMQLTAAGEAAHAGAVEAFRQAKGKYQVIYAESTAAPPDLRHAWACAAGGLMPMMLKMDIGGTPAQALNQCRYLTRFFESTDFYTMEPHDELGHAGTQWVLADPGRSYIAYSEKLAGRMGLRGLIPGRYDALWLDCLNGAWRTQGGIAVSREAQTFAKPHGIGEWCAMWIRRRDNQPATVSVAGTCDPFVEDTGVIFPGRSWEPREPQQAGLDENKLAALAQAIGGDGVVVRDGFLMKTWGDHSARGDWASSCKPVISTLLLFAVHEGRLKSIDDLVRPWVRKR